MLTKPVPTIEDVRAAARAIEGAVLRTPFLPAPRLSALTGADIYVKHENLQATASFKDRGALVKLLTLDEDERARGVVAMSAGNHAQAVAYHAQRLGIPATIVMPALTPFVKVAATRSFGATVILDGTTLADSQKSAELIAAREGAVLVHPYDDFHVIAGQGTIGLEVVADGPPLDAFVVPVGGGGLISGIATALAALSPATEIVGVETELYPAVHAALGGHTPAFGRETLAEGIAVKNTGTLTLAVIRNLVRDVVLVPESAIERAIAAFLSLQKTLAEGAGAAGLAAVLANRERFAGRRVGLVLCGGNIDPRLASNILIRQLEREERILSMRIVIVDRPGVLADIANAIGGCEGNILEVQHLRTLLSVPAKGACVDVTVETRGPAHCEEIIAAVRNRGHDVVRLDPP